MKRMGLEPKPKQMFRAAVVKANNPQMFQGTMTLLRSPAGLLVDCSARDLMDHGPSFGEREALVMVVRAAAAAGDPFIRTPQGSPKGRKGMYAQRAHLPEPLRELSLRKLGEVIEACIADDDVVSVSREGEWRGCLDVPTGPVATGSAPVRLLNQWHPPEAWLSDAA
ncbi:MAG: hypothetical protein WDO24_20680 [Pseudomonadota bacterium]